MQLTNSSKIKSIRQKKNEIIRSLVSDNSTYETPAKSLISETPIKALQKQSTRQKIMLHTPSLTFSTTEKIKVEKDQPKNALKKKCFQKQRSIKSIKDLSPLYESKILSKSNYKYKPESSLSGLSSSSRTIAPKGVFTNRKNICDKIPYNMFATEGSIIENCHRSRSKSRDSQHNFAVSKLIKKSIIRYEQP